MDSSYRNEQVDESRGNNASLWLVNFNSIIELGDLSHRCQTGVVTLQSDSRQCPSHDGGIVIASAFQCAGRIPIIIGACNGYTVVVYGHVDTGAWVSTRLFGRINWHL